MHEHWQTYFEIALRHTTSDPNFSTAEDDDRVVDRAARIADRAVRAHARRQGLPNAGELTVRDFIYSSLHDSEVPITRAKLRSDVLAKVAAMLDARITEARNEGDAVQTGVGTEGGDDETFKGLHGEIPF